MTRNQATEPAKQNAEPMNPWVLGVMALLGAWLVILGIQFSYDLDDLANSAIAALFY